MLHTRLLKCSEQKPTDQVSASSINPGCITPLMTHHPEQSSICCQGNDSKTPTFMVQVIVELMNKPPGHSAHQPLESERGWLNSIPKRQPCGLNCHDMMIALVPYYKLHKLLFFISCVCRIHSRLVWSPSCCNICCFYVKLLAFGGLH